jgi:hypothetical protein
MEIQSEVFRSEGFDEVGIPGDWTAIDPKPVSLVKGGEEVWQPVE